uniref:RING-type E3 ubiquitin transferase n=2 Tax=Brassica campestris TaxID=3711 RepID=A0A3P6BSB1_BRACM|nr:unnamed protein product [Brassica rapa]
MVRDRNAEHVLAEKGSSSHPKRQPLSSLVEDEAEPVQEAEGGENGEEGTVRLQKKKKKTCLHCCALFQDSLKSQAGVFIQNTVTLLEKAWQNTEKDNLKLFFRKAQECATDFYSREEILDRLAKEFGEEATKKTHELFFSSKTGQLAYGQMSSIRAAQRKAEHKEVGEEEKNEELTLKKEEKNEELTMKKEEIALGNENFAEQKLVGEEEKNEELAVFMFANHLHHLVLLECRSSPFNSLTRLTLLVEPCHPTIKEEPKVIESVISIAMWNAEQVITGGASSSSYSVFGEGTDTEAGDDEVTVTEEVRSGTLFELDLLDCPVCCHALTRPVFQCDNGHIACSSCCTNLRSKCPSCTLPIGVYRNRMMERVVEAVIVPCPNAKHGCTEMFSYGKELVHEKECSFALCYCPRRGCNYAGLCKDLYRHYYNCSSAREYFRCGYNVQAWMHIRDKILVLQEGREGPLVAIQCFEEEQGVYVTVNCIAPCVPGVSEFSFQLSYSSYGGADKTMSFGLGEMNRIQKVCFQTPDKDFMFVPHYFLAGRTSLKMNICVRRRGGEEEEENT